MHQELDTLRDLVAFVQELCSLAKNLQMMSRNQFYRALTDRDLFKLFETFLVHKDIAVTCYRASRITCCQLCLMIVSLVSMICALCAHISCSQAKCNIQWSVILFEASMAVGQAEHHRHH